MSVFVLKELPASAEATLKRCGELERKCIDRFRQSIEDSLAAVLKHMDEQQLTDDQRFALAMIAGVPWSFAREDDVLKSRTAPCVVNIYRGRIVVTWNDGQKYFDTTEIGGGKWTTTLNKQS